ncbi:hypothetical protein MRX96_001422 [Rhipicephalus microplus]
MAIPLASQRFGSMPEFNPSSDDIKSYFERFENLVALIEVPVTKKLRLFLKVVGNTVVYVKTTRGELVSWQEGTVEQVVSPVTYMLRVQGPLQFTHVDHSQQKKTSLWTKVPSNAASASGSQNDGGIHPGGSKVPRNLLQDSSSREVFLKGNVSSQKRGNSGHNKTGSSSPAVEQPIPTGNESSSALPRRGTRVGKPPERYAAKDLHEKSKFK